MKLLKKEIEKDGSGTVTLLPEDEEDMWHVYNLITKGDEVEAKTDRKVSTVSSTGSSSSFRVQIVLCIRVEKTAFAAAAASETTGAGDRSDARATMSIAGPVENANAYVRVGAYHTLELERGRSFKLRKESGWDRVALERVEESTKEGRGAEIGAVVCGEGTAAICLLSEHMTVVRQRIDMPIPRKRKGGTSGHDKAVDSFLSTVYQAILRLIPYDTLKAVVIASPGFTKDTLYDYVFKQAAEAGNKPLLASRSKWVRVHANTPHVHSLVEALREPAVGKMLAGAKFAREGAALDRFQKMLAHDELRAWYGPRHVALAVARGAVGTLLISDDLFRSADPAARNRWVAMVDDVRARGGDAVIFSSMHESGRQLNELTGVAAVLTYPLDVEVVEMEEREEAERLEREKRKAQGLAVDEEDEEVDDDDGGDQQDDL